MSEIMKKFEGLDLHPLSEEIVDLLVERTQTDDRNFFRILTAYQLSKIPAMMQVKVDSPDRGTIPINFYGINLAPSGHGKGHTTNIFEDTILTDFISTFTNDILPAQADAHLEKLAIDRMGAEDTPETAKATVAAEYERAGNYHPVFDSATAPAIKQLRHKILMSNIGALNLEIDEIGSNILSNMDPLSVYLELYDVGKVKDKLIKHTNESKHFVPIKGVTPANLMMFGTPTRLLNGAKEEEEFYNLMETGYARRCFFGYTKSSHKRLESDPEKVFDALTGVTSNSLLQNLRLMLGSLADSDNARKHLKVPREVSIRLIDYKIHCEQEAATYSEFDEIRKAELIHRYFKVLKLAGTYSFIEGCDEIQMEHLDNAIALAQESGKAFKDLQQREKPYVKLAKFLKEKPVEVTYTDIMEALPFFRGSNQYKQDLLKLAISWGYKHNIVIKSQWVNGIEFLSGTSLDKTNLNKLIVSTSKDIAHNYVPAEVPFDKLVQFGKNSTFHWCNHHFEDQHRQEENAIKGFNLLVFDVEDSVSIDLAKMLLEGYKAVIYTTRRHTEDHHRYRVIIPTNYVLKFDADTYKQFMKNLYTWLPFDSDTQVGQRARKWLCHNGQVEVLDGELFDVLPFIPQTQKNEERIAQTVTPNSLDNLERWFINNTGIGNRSNQLHRYAVLLVDCGKGIAEVTSMVEAVNAKIPDPLSQNELHSTVLQTAARKIQARGKK